MTVMCGETMKPTDIINDALDILGDEARGEHVLAALEAAGFAVVPVAAPDCISHMNGSANWSKMIETMLRAAARG